MTALDTNVLVRFLAQDDEAQFRVVLTALMKKGATFFVPDLVLVEVDWVLTRLYDWTRAEVAEALARLLTLHNLIFENEGRVLSSLSALRTGADLSDELIVDISWERGCRALLTFDKGMAKRHRGYVTLLKS